ncbi:unnamed protein product [Penicillium salamii]|uniref:Uncharacterized protein n=1 Tax=Penicillium salamii TaxID=1612424 RepID=A0A9W4NIR5_9EURO|nr:unnamed protein product [Penicillium salamii]CAG8134142.1 unnamed protein product [Penicillium salamii]CAG8184178.1 unnamed protein product [Penicillium salamii]CAG8275223.1 unnamed protein product [Penicillium salamii]CAG8350121.1 unnamed protein product [Penicillium salamii]
MPPSSHARFFCARPDGTLTPLVALDDFPPGVMIRDLPRNLGAGDTQGMTSCGLASPRAKPLDIGGVAHVYPSIPGNHDMEELHKTLVLILHDSKAPSHIRTLVQNTLCRVVEQSVGLASDMTNTTPPGFVHAGKAHSPATSGPSVSAQSGRAVSLKHPLDISLFRLLTLHILGRVTLPADRPTRRSSVRTGSVMASCMYRHEMPLDAASVARLGLRDIPRWYRDKYQVPSIMAEVLEYEQSGDASRNPAASAPRAFVSRAIEHNVNIPAGPAAAGKNESGNGIARGNTPRGPARIHGTPPRGPAANNNHGGTFNGHRGGHRSASANGRGAYGWKNGRGGGRNRFLNSPLRARRSSSEWSQDQESQDQESGKLAMYSYGQFGGLMNTDRGRSIEPVPKAPVASSDTKSNDDAAIPIPVLSEGVGLTSIMEEIGGPSSGMYGATNHGVSGNEDASRGPSEALHRHRAQKFSRASNQSSDGGVLLPESVTRAHDPGSSQRNIEAARRFLFGRGDDGSWRSNAQSVSDYMERNEARIESKDACFTWGPVGGPILKDASGNIRDSSVFGKYPLGPLDE